MSENAKVVSDPVDMGHRMFLTGFFTPFGTGPVLAIIGFGQTRSPWIALAALVNVFLLIGMAQYLYAGHRKMERLVWIVAAVFLALALAAAFLGRSLAAYHLAGQFLMPVFFAAMVATPAVRAFLAHQRGETPRASEAPAGELLASPAAVEPVKYESILEATPDGLGVALREDLKRPALNYSRVLRLGAALFVLCALGGVAAAVLAIIAKGSGWMLIFAALFSLPPASVLLTLADDWYFLATTKGYEKAHLANIVQNSQALSNCVTASIVVLALLAVLEVALR